MGNVFNIVSITGRTTTVTTEEQSPQETDIQISMDDDPYLGDDDATVNVIVFSDFQCPYCAAAEGYNDDLISKFKQQDFSWEAPIPKIIEEYVNTGNVKLVFRDFPLSFHQYAQKTAEAAECADEQGMFWEFHDKIFQNQASLDMTNLKQYAKDIGLDTAKFDSCLDTGQMTTEVQKDLKDGINAGVEGTPTFFIGNIKSGYVGVSGAQPFSVFKQIIDSMLA